MTFLFPQSSSVLRATHGSKGQNVPCIVLTVPCMTLKIELQKSGQRKKKKPTNLGTHLDFVLKRNRKFSSSFRMQSEDILLLSCYCSYSPRCVNKPLQLPQVRGRSGVLPGLDWHWLAPGDRRTSKVESCTWNSRERSIQKQANVHTTTPQHHEVNKQSASNISFCPTINWELFRCSYYNHCLFKAARFTEKDPLSTVVSRRTDLNQ
jgi:hypothetical protein